MVDKQQNDPTGGKQLEGEDFEKDMEEIASSFSCCASGTCDHIKKEKSEEKTQTEEGKDKKSFVDALAKHGTPKDTGFTR